MPATLAAGRHGATQLFQGIRRRLQVADAGVQQSSQLVLAAETSAGLRAGAAPTAEASAVAALVVPARAIGTRTGHGSRPAVAVDGATVGVTMAEVTTSQITSAEVAAVDIPAVDLTVVDVAEVTAPGIPNTVPRDTACRAGAPAPGLAGPGVARLASDSDVLARSGGPPPALRIRCAALAGMRLPCQVEPTRLTARARRPRTPRAAPAARPEPLPHTTCLTSFPGLLSLGGPTGSAYRMKSSAPSRSERIAASERIVRVVRAERLATHAGASIATRSAAMPRDPYALTEPSDMPSVSATCASVMSAK